MNEAPSRWDDEADVVIIGYGFAGCATAIAARDSGVDVLILEKAPESQKGGNSRVSANLVFWPDDIGNAATYFKALAGDYLDDISDEMIEVWAAEMHANRAWLERLGMRPVKFFGAEFPELAGSDCVEMLMHGEGPVGEERLWKGVIEPAMAARSIRALYETPAVSLVKYRGEITGVIAERGGRRVAVKANRAVVLTCGGFENNQAMIRNYLCGLSRCYPVGTPYNTGDGIRMGIEVGADLWHMSNVSGPEFFFKAREIPVSRWINIPHANSFMFVAGDGERFMAEGALAMGADRHGKIEHHGLWMQQPAPVPIHIVFDESFRKAGSIGKSTACWDVSHGNVYGWSRDNLRELEKGWIVKAETIHELAGLIGVPSDALKTSAARLNEFARIGEDTDFGRPADRLAALATPPYYAMELTPSFINTQGGPRRDKDARVIGVDGKPIARLYSAGELGSIYSFLYQGGGNIGECFAFGRIAGLNAAREPTAEDFERAGAASQ